MKITLYTLLIILLSTVGSISTASATAMPATTGERASGQVTVDLHNTTESLSIKMNTPRHTERVLIILAGKGTVIHRETTLVTNDGTSVEIPMGDLPDGVYSLRVKGTTLSYSGRFNKE